VPSLRGRFPTQFRDPAISVIKGFAFGDDVTKMTKTQKSPRQQQDVIRGGPLSERNTADAPNLRIGQQSIHDIFFFHIYEIKFFMVCQPWSSRRWSTRIFAKNADRSSLCHPRRWIILRDNRPFTLMTKPPVNQKLVAEQAGVSQSTVSLILSGRKVSSEATRIKVVETAERLGYRPNLLVHGIQTGKTKVIGVMAPPFDFYWTEILYGIHDSLIKADHVSINIWTSHQGSSFRDRTEPEIDPLEQIHRLLDRRVDGVILWPPVATLFHEHIKEFSSRNLPVVTIDHELPPEFNADSVGSDEAAGGALVVKHLWNLGHRRFAHLAGPHDASWAKRRRTAFEQSLAKKGITNCPVIEGDLANPMQGIEPARTLLSGPNPPSAVFAATDPLAKSVYQAAAERGIQIPRDLSVIGFADDDFAANMNPPLTTIRQPAYEIGCKAAELVLARSASKNASDKPHQFTLPVSLVARESTARVID